MGSSSSKGANFSSQRNIGPLDGKVILVTGGNSGLGKESIIELVKHNPREIWLGARSSKKAAQAIEEIKQRVPNHAVEIKVLEMDLTSLQSVSAAAHTFNSQSPRLDILLLNAGIMAVPAGLTKDGYEIQFGTNHVGHALFTKLLLPTLLKTAEEPGSDVRVVVLSSSAHQYAPKDKGINFDTLKTNGASLGPTPCYGQSKLANILFAQELARKYPQLKAPVVHPGLVNTNLANTMGENSWVMKVAWKVVSSFIGVDVQTGVQNQLWAATADKVKSGEYYEPIGVTGRGKKWTNDPALARKLWDWTEKELENWK